MKQITDTVLMIEPACFGFNQEAARTNSFQKPLDSSSAQEVQALALQEFHLAVARLQEAGVEVHVIQDTSHSADAVFPNNWFSTHAEGFLLTYPMALPNRRAERKETIIQQLLTTYGYREHLSLERFEEQAPPLFLEGTGSLVLDRVNRIAYAARSPRTAPEVLEQFCSLLQYKPVLFNAYGPKQEAIYHTNVMMCIGEDFAAVALEVVEESDRKHLTDALQAGGKEIIALSKEQTHFCFAGNMLQLRNKQNEKVLALSQTAFESLSAKQLEQLKRHNHHLVPLAIPVIERCGGGSVRCMLAEIFPSKQP